jgi:hypothetical protein
MFVVAACLALVGATSVSSAEPPPKELVQVTKMDANTITLASMPVMELTLRTVGVPEVSLQLDTAAVSRHVLFSPSATIEKSATVDTSAEVVHLRYANSIRLHNLKRPSNSTSIDLARLRHRLQTQLINMA